MKTTVKELTFVAPFYEAEPKSLEDRTYTRRIATKKDHLMINRLRNVLREVIDSMDFDPDNPLEVFIPVVLVYELANGFYKRMKAMEHMDEALDAKSAIIAEQEEELEELYALCDKLVQYQTTISELMSALANLSDVTTEFRDAVNDDKNKIPEEKLRELNKQLSEAARILEEIRAENEKDTPNPKESVAS